MAAVTHSNSAAKMRKMTSRPDSAESCRPEVQNFSRINVCLRGHPHGPSLNAGTNTGETTSECNKRTRKSRVQGTRGCTPCLRRAHPPTLAPQHNSLKACPTQLSALRGAASTHHSQMDQSKDDFKRLSRVGDAARAELTGVRSSQRSSHGAEVVLPVFSRRNLRQKGLPSATSITRANGTRTRGGAGITAMQHISRVCASSAYLHRAQHADLRDSSCTHAPDYSENQEEPRW